MRRIEPESDDRGYVKTDVTIIDQKLKDATRYYGLLVLDEKGKKNFVEQIKAIGSKGEPHTKISEEDISGVIKGIEDIWRKYPVIFSQERGDAGYPSYGGSITMIRTAPRFRNEFLTEEENDLFRGAQSLIKSTCKIRWNESPCHERIGYWAALKADFPFPDIVKKNAPVPDQWPGNCPFPISTIIRSINHYYNPGGSGKAPENTENYVMEARKYYLKGSGYYDQSATNLGYATHFLTDVGNPMHTGREIEQALCPWVHFNYEGYVGERWCSSNFENVLNTNDYYFWYDDWKQATADLACYSNGYLDTLMWNIFEKGPFWSRDQDPTIDTVTTNVILRTGRYTNGLALYAENRR